MKTYESLKTKIPAVIAASLLIAAGLISGANAAGAARLQLSVASGSYTVGQQFSTAVNVATSPAEPIDTVFVRMTYDSARLRLDGISASGSAFGSQLTQSGSGGNITVSRYIDAAGGQSAVTGTGRVVNLTFTALAAGSASIAFSGTTELLMGGNDVWDHNAAAGNYSISAAQQQPAPQNPAQQPSQPSGQNNNGSQQPGNADNPDDSDGDDSPPAETVDDLPAPSESDSASYLVAILVLGRDDQPVSGVEVTLGDKKANTDSSGVAGFSGVEPGTYNASADGTSMKVTVSDSGDPTTVQEFTLKQAAADKIPVWVMLSALGVLVLLGGIVALFRSGFGLPKFGRGNSGTSSAVIGGPAKTPEPPKQVSGAASAPTVIKPTETPQSEQQPEDHKS